ncbi:MAG: glycosyltransferase family 2 protein [Spirochaetales bacterium]|nr:glycosyltransferase family 2 protein [Spirochaetales bacterium]
MADPYRRPLAGANPDARITAIVPTYNRLPMLREAVFSVLKQTHSSLELVVVDDGSDDGTAGWCRRLATEHPGSFRYLPLSHCGMPGKVRNAGARLARGEYLAFLDSDDLWKPDKLARQIAFFQEHPDIRICHTREIWQRGQKIVSQAGQRHGRSGTIFADALKKCIIGPSTVMMRRELFEELGGFREDLEIAEDYELWLRVTARCPVGYIDEPLVIKRGGHADQLSERYGQIEIFRIRALQLNLEAGTFRGEQRDLAARELVRKCRIYARGCEKRGRNGEAQSCLEIAQRYDKETTSSLDWQ